ncbi:hypothetical protein B0H14DRAFT_1092775 [Mycena olivaceomarginata]|nr:hypothetical protein B0H14DRAFT_1092775 [Mycena olivaceomarginata]
MSPLTVAWAMSRPLPTLSCSVPLHLPSLGSSQYPPAKRGTKISSLWQMPLLVALYPGSRTLNAGGLCPTPGLFPLCCFLSFLQKIARSHFPFPKKLRYPPCSRFRPNHDVTTLPMAPCRMGTIQQGVCDETPRVLLSIPFHHYTSYFRSARVAYAGRFAV